MKLKFSDGTKIPIINNRADGKNLLIDTDADKSTEELQSICTIPGNTAALEIQTDKGKLCSAPTGYTYCYIRLNKDKTKTIVLAKESDTTAAAIADAQGNALAAKTEAVETSIKAEALESQLQNTETALTDVEIAVLELQERIGE